MYNATWPKEVWKITVDLMSYSVYVNIGNANELVANKSITQVQQVKPDVLLGLSVVGGLFLRESSRLIWAKVLNMLQFVVQQLVPLFVLLQSEILLGIFQLLEMGLLYQLWSIKTKLYLGFKR